jgi:hypothetical protein
MMQVIQVKLTCYSIMNALIFKNSGGNANQIQFITIWNDVKAGLINSVDVSIIIVIDYR